MSGDAVASRAWPASVDIERAVLGWVLLGGSAVLRSLDGRLAAADFYRVGHRTIYAAALALAEEGVEVTTLLVLHRLHVLDHLDEAGGIAYISALADDLPSIEALNDCAARVREAAGLRRFLAAVGDLQARAITGGESLTTLCDAADGAVRALAQDVAGSTSTWRGGEALTAAYAAMEQAASRDGFSAGVATGYEELDRLLCGLQPGQLVVLAARPRVGKSALALCIAEHVARQGSTVGFLSLEMSESELTRRRLAAEAQVDFGRIRSGQLDRERDWPRLDEAATLLYERPLYLDATAGLTLAELRARARRLQVQHGLALLVVDYLQLVRGPRVESREQSVAAIARGLKALAAELMVPVLALAQLNRDCERRPDKHPMLSDLRETGEIENAADVVLFLYRDELYNAKSADKGIAEVIVAKQRNGPTGCVRLAFLGAYMRFAPLADDDHRAGGSGEPRGRRVDGYQRSTT